MKAAGRARRSASAALVTAVQEERGEGPGRQEALAQLCQAAQRLGQDQGQQHQKVQPGQPPLALAQRLLAINRR